MIYEIEGGQSISGEVQVSGAKNSALPILISSLLSSNPLHLLNIPNLKDVDTTIAILESIGVDIKFNSKSISLSSKHIKKISIDDNLANAMRASVLVLGAMLGRFGEVEISYPGGCAIGERPINLHLDALEKMGAEIAIKNNKIFAKAKKLIGTEINFEKVTVTGTSNIMMAASLAKGVTIIKNAAKEPEVVDLANCLMQRGVKISGAGESVIKIEGLDEDKLKEIHYAVIPDRIEAATYLLSAGLTQGKLTVLGANHNHLKAFLEKLKETGFTTQQNDEFISIHPLNKNKFKPTNIKTAPFPDFATDLQSLYAVVNCYANGISIIEESIFENRFCYLNELHKMGALFELKDKKAYITGVQGLIGSHLKALDLRAGACLVLAALSATGTSTIGNIHFIERGYEDLHKKLNSLGAKIKLIS